MTARPLVEICVEGIDGALAAAAGGADRAELCASLLEGGITPSLGTVREALRRVPVPLACMLRPRGGDFLYSEAEFATMLEDAAALASLGAGAVVAGCLRPDGTVDEARMAALAARTGAVPLVCHRAFDMTPDPHAALEALVRSGVRRVLTSGQRPLATEALPLLRALVERAGERIAVLGCGGLEAGSIAAVLRATGLRELHLAAPVRRDSGMTFRNPRIGMGATELEREYTLTLTDPERVRAAVAAAEG